MPPTTLGGVGLGDSEWLGIAMDEAAEIPKWGFLGGIILRRVMILGAVQAKPSGSSEAFNSGSAMPVD